MDPFLQDPYIVQPGVGGWFQHAERLSKRRGYLITMQALKAANPEVVRKRGNNIQVGDALNVPKLPMPNPLTLPSASGPMEFDLEPDDPDRPGDINLRV
jgi:hypothetical protein